jgi:hypothetical protein
MQIFKVSISFVKLDRTLIPWKFLIVSVWFFRHTKFLVFFSFWALHASFYPIWRLWALKCAILSPLLDNVLVAVKYPLKIRQFQCVDVVTPGNHSMDPPFYTLYSWGTLWNHDFTEYARRITFFCNKGLWRTGTSHCRLLLPSPGRMSSIFIHMRHLQ